MQPFYILFIITTVITFSSCILFIVTRKRQDPSMLFLGVMLAASFTADMVGLFPPKSISMAPNVAGNVYTLVEITAIMLIYQAALAYPKKSPIYFVLFILLGIQIYQMTIYPGIHGFPSISRIALSLAVTTLCVLYYFKLMRGNYTTEFTQLPMFWLNVGMLAYFGGNIFLFVIRDYIISTNRNSIVNYWVLHNALLLIENVFFMIGLWRGSRVKQFA